MDLPFATTVKLLSRILGVGLHLRWVHFEAQQRMFDVSLPWSQHSESRPVAVLSFYESLSTSQMHAGTVEDPG